MLRSRNKAVLSNQSTQSTQQNQPETTNKFKRYTSTILSILIFILLIYIIWTSYHNQSSNNEVNEQSVNIDIHEIIANELQNELENADSDTSTEQDSLMDISDDIESNEENKEFLNLPQDECNWRPENLFGACFGLSFMKDIHSVIDCKKKCCEDEECITWQYHPTKGCQNGGNVRFGLEHADTPNWCEPMRPKQWNGKRLKNKDNNSNKCEWEEENVNTQCFGLGTQQKNVKTMEECNKLCCETKEKECQLWQFRDDKGCFIGKSNNCDSDVLSYIGQRKVY
eukprot:547482_1